jgi:hypothetical protein
VRLITLDSSWTAELKQPPKPSDKASLADLGGVADELRTELGEMRQRAFALRQVLARTGDAQFDSTIGQLTASVTHGESAGPAQQTLDQGGLKVPLSTVLSACDYVVTHADAEIALIGADFNRVQAGESPVGDFRQAFRCALFLVSIGAAVVAAIGIPGPTPFVALAVAGQVMNGAAGWTGSGCPAFLPTIQDEPPASAPTGQAPQSIALPPSSPPAKGSWLSRLLSGPASPGGSAAAFNPHKGTHLAIVFLGLVALACATGVVLIVLHRSTPTATAAITAMSSIGAAAVGGIAGIVTGTISHGAPNQDTQSTQGGG